MINTLIFKSISNTERNPTNCLLSDLAVFMAVTHDAEYILNNYFHQIITEYFCKEHYLNYNAYLKCIASVLTDI